MFLLIGIAFLIDRCFLPFVKCSFSFFLVMSRFSSSVELVLGKKKGKRELAEEVCFSCLVVILEA